MGARWNVAWNCVAHSNVPIGNTTDFLAEQWDTSFTRASGNAGFTMRLEEELEYTSPFNIWIASAVHSYIPK